MAALDAALKGRIGKSPGAQPDHPQIETLTSLLDAATQDGTEFQDVLRATSAAAQWYPCYEREADANHPSAELVDGLFAAQVVGPHGLIKSDALIAGYFLIGPNVSYPLHEHLAEELYYVLSGDLQVHHGFDGPLQTIEPGRYSITPSGMPHRLNTGSEAVLMLYIWTGTVACDVWWWEHVADEQWRRFVPPRTSAPRMRQGTSQS